MIYKSVNRKDFFEICDDDSNEIFYGCKQDWYSKPWQRLSGCGPSVASNIIIYLNRNNQDYELEKKYNSKKDCMNIMNEVWKYVTPTLKGVNSTKIFYKGMIDYAKSKNLNAQYEFVDIPKDKKYRPKFMKVLNFIDMSLQKDCPVAFLNLCNGDEKCLDKWHWVTIISLECSEDGTCAYVDILDEGIIKKIDLVLWYETTTLGGGFVNFTVSMS